MTSSSRRRRLVAACLILAPLSLVGAATPGAVVAPAHTRVASPTAATAQDVWVCPVRTCLVVAPYRAPAHRYGAGHRGADVRAPVGSPVAAAHAGTVAFRGTVADRPLITVDDGAGSVTTLEPVTSSLAVGTVVAAGTPVGVAATGGHAPVGTVHIGVRRDGEYVDPLQLIGGIRRAVLLPCCS